MKNLLDLKTFFKFLSRNKAYTAIDLFGLSVSLTFVILIAVYSAQEFSTDKFQEKGERVYFVGSEDVPCVGAAIPYMLKERYPEIEKVCPLVMDQFNSTKVESEGKIMNADLMFADSTFFDLFSFPLLQGNPEHALIAQNNLVVSQSFARKLFGSEDVMGRAITVGDTLQMVVSGVVADLKHSTLPEADIIMPWRTVAAFNPSLAPDELNNAGSTTCAVLVHEGADFTSRAEDIAAWYKTFFWPYENRYWKEVRMESLANAYFSEWTSWPLLHGDKTFVVVLVSVGVVILVFAILNYINLSVAHRDRRYLIFQCGHTPGARVGDFIGHTWDLEANATELLLLAAAPDAERLRILRQTKIPKRFSTEKEFLAELDTLHALRHTVFYSERQAMWIVGGLVEPPGFPAATLGFGMESRTTAEETLPAVHRCMESILRRLAPPVPFNC